ncbi:hypothetical protein L2E82_49340 [Cichorium intybus]|uniref:Uncharacterized protein n=1 Tax=Cichorium intybus TaxID=13427 RepID=A0ACB8Z0N1_CICIN|nr:hypothetical protein L2E82_49340 [Cichorium intybus]
MKSANILLDKNWRAKITNVDSFKFSSQNNLTYTLLSANVAGTLGYLDPVYYETGVLTNLLSANVAGTLGYLDPVYYETRILTKESDIYSFGIVLMEALCGRLAYEKGPVSLGHLATRKYEEGQLTEIIDPNLRKHMSPDSLDVFSALAYQCLKDSRKERPTTVEVVEKLEKVLALQQKFEDPLGHQQVADNLKDKREGEDDFKVKNMDHMKISLEDIKSATHNFHDDYKIGIGGFGKVYKAKLDHFDFRKYVKEGGYGTVSMVELLGYQRTQSIVAIKRLDKRFGQGSGEFLQEISVIPHFTHKNLVTLVGFCDEDDERILVYEYASNGSLDSHIESNNNTNCHTWATRLQICLDAASGLEFLHNGLGEHYRIIHRDIKAANILLGQNNVGMISDFGLSKFGPANLEATFVMTQPVGTPVYIDPQYLKTRKLTKESDVYSFGVVLFESLSGRLVYSRRPNNDPDFLLRMAKQCFEQKNVTEIIDSKFKKEFEKSGSSILDDKTCPDSIKIFAAIAYKCCKEKQEDRPTMTDVVNELEKALKSHINRVEAFRITLRYIRSATNSFRDIKEEGPPGEVYCGELSHLRGHGTVTIKRLRPSVYSSGEEFVKDIARLYSYSHENIVPFLGFCEEGTERIVVFEHMVKGSLKEHLTSTSLVWKQRLKICIDAAYGIAYIHSHADTEQTIHGDLKSSSILITDDWKAAISDFIIFKGAGTLGYRDPLYTSTGFLTQESDVYSFGVVLFEILSGRLSNERIKIDQQQPLPKVPNVETQVNSARGRGTGEEEPEVFLAQWAAKCFQNKKIEDIIFYALKKDIAPTSLEIFSKIAYHCLMEQRKDRPTMTKVVEELEKALDCQDEWEWEQKLPTDYKEIIQMSKSPVASTITKKDLHSLMSLGILLQNEKWFSISMNGARNEMVSAKVFSYQNVSSPKSSLKSCPEWRSVRKSRFPHVARIYDISNLNIQIDITTQFLTPETMYGVYLVFKFCDRRKVSSRPLYVNLKYTKAGETLNAYFAEWKGGSEWLTVELFRFWSDKESIDFEVLLESFSTHYCGRRGIFVEGIEFQAIQSVDIKQKEELKDGLNTGRILNRKSNMYSCEQMVIDDKNIKNDGMNVEGMLTTQLDLDWWEQMLYHYENIIRRSGKPAEEIDYEEELCFLLSDGIRIDKGEKFFSLSKVNQKKCQMLCAKAIIYDSSNVRFRELPTGSRFGKYAKILSHQDLGIKCDIETQMLSSNTTYACYLVFKLSEDCRGLEFPVKARDLLLHRKERTKIISFTYPSIVNLDKIKWIPEQREDGWMEVMVWETIFDNTNNDEYIPMDLKLSCYEGNMYGLILYGIEFRPIA